MSYVVLNLDWFDLCPFELVWFGFEKKAKTVFVLYVIYNRLVLQSGRGNELSLNIAALTAGLTMCVTCTRCSGKSLHIMGEFSREKRCAWAICSKTNTLRLL